MLYLASGSAARRWLLDQAGIPYTVISHAADETLILYKGCLDKFVQEIAIHKITHAVLPSGIEGKEILVLTADTLVADSSGAIHGKPISREDVFIKIRVLSGTVTVSTGFCLDKMRFEGGSWLLEKRIARVVRSECEFEVPEQWVEKYLQHTESLSIAGGLTIEGYGLQFLKAMRGSYTGIIGLPLYEVRQALEELDFFKAAV